MLCGALQSMVGPDKREFLPPCLLSPVSPIGNWPEDDHIKRGGLL